MLMHNPDLLPTITLIQRRSSLYSTVISLTSSVVRFPYLLASLQSILDRSAGQLACRC